MWPAHFAKQQQQQTIHSQTPFFTYKMSLVRNKFHPKCHAHEFYFSNRNKDGERRNQATTTKISIKYEISEIFRKMGFKQQQTIPN